MVRKGRETLVRTVADSKVRSYSPNGIRPRRRDLLQYKVDYCWLGKETEVNELGQAKHTLLKYPINQPTHFYVDLNGLVRDSFVKSVTRL
jgi:hypothetical protein